MSTPLRVGLQIALFLFLVGLCAATLLVYGSNLYNLLPVPTTLPTLTVAASDTPLPSDTPAPTDTPLPETALPTDTSTTEATPTDTPQSGFQFPTGEVTVAQGFCRYGPGTAYLYYDDLYQGQTVTIGGRNAYGGWVLVQPHDFEIWCWAAESLFAITGDVQSVIVQDVRLPITTFATPPTGVQASRNGDQVTITWAAANYIPVGDRRGYLLEAFLCQNGAYFWQAIQTDKTQISLQDTADCAQPAKGTLRIAEKHGYTDPVTIPWP